MKDLNFSKRGERQSWWGASEVFVGDRKEWRTAVWGCRDVEDDVKESDQSRGCVRACTAMPLDAGETATDA